MDGHKYSSSFPQQLPGTAQQSNQAEEIGDVFSSMLANPPEPKRSNVQAARAGAAHIRTVSAQEIARMPYEEAVRAVEFRRAVAASGADDARIPAMLNPNQQAYSRPVYRPEPLEMGRGRGIPRGANLYEQTYRQTVSAARRPRLEPGVAFPSLQPANQQTYSPLVAQPARAGLRTISSATPAQYLTTSKNKYEILKPICGGQANGMSVGINMIKNTVSGLVVVQKIVRVDDKQRKARVQAEIDTLVRIKGCGSPGYLNQLVEHVYDPKTMQCHIVLEYCDFGTVLSQIKKHLEVQKPTQEAFAWHVLAGISKAIHFLHSGVDADVTGMKEPAGWNPICHLDIKPENVFLSSPGQQGMLPRVVVGDFGCAVTRDDITSAKAYRDIQTHGTVSWFPPELKVSPYGGFEGRYGKLTDIWQMGGVVQALCRLILTPDKDSVRRNQACGTEYSAEINAVVNACMAEQVRMRPSAADVVTEVRIQMGRFRLIF